MKTIRIFPNNKPWITKDRKVMLNQKKLAFLQGDIAYVRNLNKEFRSKVKMAKLQYKIKAEHKLLSGNASDAWKGLNTMMGRKQQKKPLVSENPVKFVNDINKFYARFDISYLSSLLKQNSSHARQKP